MEWVETTAKTVDEAKDLALDKLGVDEADAEFEVLEEPRQGLVRANSGEARVRARVEPKAPRAKEDRRDRRRRKPKGKSGGRSSGAGTDATSSATATMDAAEAPAPGTDGGNAANNTDAATVGGTGQGGNGGGGRKRNRKPNNRNKQDKPERKESSMEEVRTCVDEFLTGLVEAFDIDTTVSIDDSDEQIMATIEGKHGLLLGQKARTLDAIQELTRVTAQRTAPSSIRIKVDVGGYREARKQSLAGFAQQAAEKARTEGVDVKLEPMSSADRKVVHDTLNDEPGVSTRSAGADPRRFVIVVPDSPVADDATEADDSGADGADD